MKKHILLMLMGLAACSSTDDSIETVTVSSETVAVGDVPVDVRFDAGTDSVIYSIGGSTIATLSRDATLDRGSFDGFQDDPSDDYAFRSVSASGDSAITVGAADGSPTILSATYERINDTAIPVSGATTFTGDYLGLITETGQTELLSVVTGDMSLTANFGTSMVSGSISNRVVGIIATGAPNGDAATDLALEATGLDALGGFSGDASGSAITAGSGSLYTITSGRYTGLISGATADETVGGVVIDYTRSMGSTGPTGLVETGGFIATE
ncbi:hypothetical protein [Loktanella sp. Alg231-35]|uniref:hypothetical protein n=1 Tax=Loktanella sp. Alg231-35 TaxID=1922220 RepID=UPI00131F0DF1|nr:hypothetical protein [Loktanella sp. Alg231-35]